MNIVSIEVVYNVLFSFNNTTLMSFQTNVNTATVSVLEVIDFPLLVKTWGKFENGTSVNILVDKPLCTFIILSS